MSDQPQSFANHAKMVPAYHYVLAALLLALLIWSVIGVVRDPSLGRLMMLVMTVALLMTALFARVFALGVQDRVIRLEERMRMERLLPDDLRAHIGELTTAQLIGLRFASDEELPDLVRQVIEQGMTDRKAIKQAVKSWRADNQRI